jgi:hypothetical protein
MKRGQFNFVWIFAIIAGASILALAIYGTTNIGENLRFQSDTEVAKSISVITDPLQSGFAEGSYGKISFRDETRINNVCYDNGFGKNDISVSTHSNIGEEWIRSGVATSIYNKYVFSSEQTSGKDYYVFSKPFEFPYKVSDLIFLMSGEYCFLDAPEEVIDEVDGLGIPNIQTENCTSNTERVCFDGGQDCDIIVRGSCRTGCESDYDFGSVSKDGEEMEYVGSLMYGAIFSDKDIYDCNVQRLLYRAKNIADEFVNKADFMDARGCGTDLRVDLLMWSDFLNEAGVDEIISLSEFGKSMNKKNNIGCEVW